MEAVLLALGAGVLTLLYAAYLAYKVINEPSGNDKMREIAKAIQEGANAFLTRQYKTLAPIVLVLFVVMWFFVNQQMAIAFLVGVVSSALAGYIGMQVSVRANVRVAEAAKKGLSQALGLSFKGGAVTGMALAGLGLIGVSVLYMYFGSLTPLIGYGFGASLISLFARVGGGIYTKAADVGADLVGKVEKGIPEDDPRNPAVIADNVGDNVGDCAGMAADVFESFVVTVIASMLIGLTLVEPLLVQIPLGIAALGVLASILGSLFVRIGKGNKIMPAFYQGIIVSALLMIVFAYFYLTSLALSVPAMTLFVPVMLGAIVTLLLFVISEYYTSTEFGPVKSVAKAATTGAGTNLISGLAVGMESTALPTLVILAAIIISYMIGGLYGVGLAAAAMLSLSAIVIAIDAYGPITDNAGGIAEMSHLPESVRKITDALDAVGNTTKATTKGYAIGGAALGALALFVAYAEEAHLTDINLLSTPVVVGLFVGALLPFIFSSLLVLAVGRAAFQIVEEVRRQFKEIKGLMAGTGRADYAKCVDIATATALRELALPGILAVLTPLLVGYLFGAAALGGLLAGVIAGGLMLALMMTTAGAAWDNAKKYIEQGHHGGKGSDAHKAAVVGDTVGDPLKDTAGPALNALIKVVNTVSLVFAGLVIAKSLNLI
ncbi:K(+)-stimulated pyrophosphate-energized sodium pump [Candidatus Bilamarchaeum dharawalense]|uniref:K(+)-insensitive pyrophosphate-energized proton pump n=1 Tax=Candidatus Bilamarchaeum dharawalense TaxID=2885759 RepID=A0A5E4LPC9_9ARCH|nr:K(+)-stimulated pyrophosphate-energized sodium pump [Candidatus Bilamarchaeum dharawalense]